ncbi:TraR/DksA family transcriptional regulator [Streptomyces sp. BK239]|uniref:TraR/DksA family transcriptional regulator n=1 Tax=Streptomyces sp. BK239 TaxID=2512155 RepID=UPI00387E3674
MKKETRAGPAARVETAMDTAAETTVTATPDAQKKAAAKRTPVARKTAAAKKAVAAEETAVAGKAAVKASARKAQKATRAEASPAGAEAATGNAARAESAPRTAAGRRAGSRGGPGRGGDGGAVAEGDGKQGAVRKSRANKAGAASAAEQTGATTVVAKKTPGTATAAKNAVPKARPAAAEAGDLAVRPGEEPWTPEEVEEARAELQSEFDRLRTELVSSEAALAGLMRDSGDGAGDDQADTGTKNITREHELALAANAREMMIQTEHALERLDAGTYGLCENCGKPIGKARMQAFPRATLCVECKQKQERRY